MKSSGRNCYGKVVCVIPEALEAVALRDTVEQFASSHSHKFDFNRYSGLFGFRKIDH